MNRPQKNLIARFIIILTVTAAAVLAMINLKDFVNRSEAMLAMEHLGQKILQYQKEHGYIPSKSFVDQVRNDLPGSARLGKIEYRSMWIDFDSGGDEILAYTEKNYSSLFLSDGFIVIRLDGSLEWMEKQDFLQLLAKQQSPEEIEFMKTPD